MSLLNPTEVRDILRSSRIGTWRVEFGAHIQPRFYADAVMDELLGISGDISPQERFIFHRTRIHPDDMELFKEYSDKLSEIRSEIVYCYIHPVWGEMMVRCGGVCVSSDTDIVIITGTHHDISDTIRLEKKQICRAAAGRDEPDTPQGTAYTGKLLSGTAGYPELWCHGLYTSRS